MRNPCAGGAFCTLAPAAVPRPVAGPPPSLPADAPPDREFRVPVERLLGAIMAQCGAVAAAVRLAEPETGRLRLVGSTGVSGPFLPDTWGCPSCHAPERHPAEADAPGICRCPRLDPAPAVAIRLRHADRECGLLTLHFPPGAELPQESTPLLGALGDLLGMALDNARLAEEDARQAQAHLYASLMQERQLLANEVHDSLAQNLACLRMRATLLKDAVQRGEGERAGQYLAEVDESLAVAHGRVRELITQFRTAMDPGGLLHALQKETASLSGLGGVELSFENRLESLDLPAEQGMQVLHIVREALANVVKHAGARHGRVTLSGGDDGIRITIEDDGMGLAASSDGGDSQHGHFGLNIMRERARHLGGEVRFDSAPGVGTRIFLSIPAPRQEARP